MNYLVISSGLRDRSNSRKMGEVCFSRVQEKGEQVDFIDLSNHDIPFCDGDNYVVDATTRMLREKVSAAHGIVLATPVYNFDTNSAAKNFIEITGQAWEEKVVGFLCAAGGQRSYMSIMPLANSLMLDFRCVIIPRFVYATGRAFSDGVISDETIVDRIYQLVDELVCFTTSLNSG